MPEQKRLLQYTLKDVDESPRELDEIVSAWRAGDAARLNTLLAKGFDEFPELYGPLTSDRNRHWMPTLTRLLAEPRDCLVIVGALHLVGRDGVLELFADRILPFDTRAARRYADLAVKARAAGKGFPTPDGYIAAIAAAHDFAVASRDTSAFTAAGLSVIDPWTVAV